MTLNAKLRKLTYLLLVVAFSYQPATAQSVGIDTIRIESLIQQWNFANNSRSTETFESIYSDTLLFYTETLSRPKAIALKLALFKRKPDFQQRIKGGISCRSYASGVVKCDFEKEVLEGGRIRIYPSYVLVSYENNRHRIVGESDYATDRTLGYRLGIGRPLEFDNAAGESADNESDSPLARAPPQAMISGSSEGSLNPQGAIEPFSSMGMIVIPKGYVYILIGILIAGGALIFIADASRSRMKRQELALREEATGESRELPSQTAFEAFVLTLFDPLFFVHRRLHADGTFSGESHEGKGPDIELQFRHKETEMKFAVKCLYFSKEDAGELRFPPLQQQRLKKFEEEAGISVYYIAGVGGKPDDPRDLFLIPVKKVRSEYIERDALSTYRKSGMFFYKRSSGKLQ